MSNQDVHAGNLLIGIDDESQLRDFEETELTRPSSRKVVDDSTIHVSQVLLGNFGPLYLCDLGEAQFGSLHEGTAMPIQYRTPEVILGIPWGHSVDMWSVGLLVWWPFLISPLLFPFSFSHPRPLSPFLHSFVEPLAAFDFQEITYDIRPGTFLNQTVYSIYMMLTIQHLTTHITWPI